MKSTAELLRSGSVPAVAEAADAAGVSRATAYRYFPSQDLLLTEATLDAATPAIDRLLASSDFPVDPEERLDRLLNAVYDMVFEDEPVFRALLRLSLGAPSEHTPRRGGRRLAWLEAALSPVRSRLAPGDFKRLVATLAVFLGVECVVVLRDVCALSPRAIRQTARSAALAILRASLLPAPESGQ